jgi:hypothetical protein
MVTISTEVAGFAKDTVQVNHNPASGTRVAQALRVGAAMESVIATVEPGLVSTNSAAVSVTVNAGSVASIPRDNRQIPQQEPSANVNELQRKVAGVLPVAIKIPRSGSSYRFLRPLVVDEETRLTFAYRR